MPHRLDRITIAGYKSIREQTIELRELNVLIGANGAGKSNLIGTFRLLHELVAGQLAVAVARQGGANRLLHLGRRVTGALRVRLEFGPNAYQLVLEPTVEDSLFFQEETATFQGHGYPRPYAERLGVGHREAKLVEVAARGEKIAQHVLDSIESWRVFHFHDTSDTAPVKQPHFVADNQWLRWDGLNLAAFLYRLSEQGKLALQGGPAGQMALPFFAAYRQIVAAVQGVAPYFEDFLLLPSPARPDLIQLAWKQKGSDEYFPAAALSDGTLRFILLATLLLQPESLLPATILIDEPELGLHPFAIQKLAAMAKAAATKTQVIMATQSVTLMNQFAPEDVIVVDREDQASVFRRLDAAEIASWAEDYSLGELWEKNVLGGRPQ